MLAGVGGAVLALGFIWLFVEAFLHYMGGHGGTIVGWHGPWPKNASEQEKLNDRLTASQERVFHRLRRARPVPIALVIAGIVLIIVAAF